MATAQSVTWIIIVTTEQVVGFSLNSFMVVFNFKSLKNEPIINASTLIYFAMGLVNVLMQMQFMAQNFLSSFWPSLVFVREVTLTLIVLSMIFTFCSFWLTGWLCAYYCVTIVNSRHQLSVLLRRVFSSLMPHLLLLTAIGSVFLSVPAVWMFDIVFQMKPQSNSTLVTSFRVMILLNPIYMAIEAVLSICLPFLLAAVSTGVTTVALLRHVTKMKHKVSGYNRPNVQSLISATRTMILLLTFSVIFCAFELMYFLGEKNSSSHSIALSGWIVVLCFPSIQALIIIHAIPKLRKTILEKLCFRKEINNGTHNT